MTGIVALCLTSMPSTNIGYITYKTSTKKRVIETIDHCRRASRNLVASGVVLDDLPCGAPCVYLSLLTSPGKHTSDLHLLYHSSRGTTSIHTFILSTRLLCQNIHCLTPRHTLAVSTLDQIHTRCICTLFELVVMVCLHRCSTHSVTIWCRLCHAGLCFRFGAAMLFCLGTVNRQFWT